MTESVFIVEAWSVGSRIERTAHNTLEGAKFDALMHISTMNEEKCREHCEDRYWGDSNNYLLTSKDVDSDLLEDNSIGTSVSCLIVIEELEVFTGQ